MGCHTRCIRPKARQSNTRPLKKNWDFNYFCQKLASESFGNKQLWLYQCDWEKGKHILQLCYCKMGVKVKKRSGQWGMTDLVQKNSKLSAFYDNTWPIKNFGKNILKTPLNQKLFVWLVQKVQHFQAYSKDRTQNCSLCLLWNPKVE